VTLVHAGSVSYRKLVSLVALMAVLLLGAAPQASAASVQHVRIEIHDAFVDEFLTEECGTAIVVTVDASLNVTLRYNTAGLLVQEIDPAGGGTITTTGVRTDQSFSYSFNTTIIDYGSGAATGSAFTMKFVGLIGHVPGFISSDAGLALVAGTVRGFEANGTPLLDITNLVAFHGHSNDGEDVLAATCQALT
jgi:hypothetical protein